MAVPAPNGFIAIRGMVPASEVASAPLLSSPTAIVMGPLIAAGKLTDPVKLL